MRSRNRRLLRGAVCLSLFFASTPSPAGHAGLMAEHGTYSSQYLGDWADLPNGRMLPRRGAAGLPRDVADGSDVRKFFKGQKLVELKDISLRVKWLRPFHKFRTTLFHIRDCEKVVVENVSIIQADADYRAAHSILVENCDTVVIKNSYLAGAVGRYHIRIEGCRRVFIDNVEISGHDYGKDGVRSGGGIWIDNGAVSDKNPGGRPNSEADDMEFCVIQNCYIHDNLAADEWRNQDGILIHSASNGIVFNCFFENWKSGDAALDVSHRRSDGNYRGKVFRVERNVFKNNKLVKTVGDSYTDNRILFANNLYVNCMFADYHKGWDAYHVNETFIFDENYEEDTFFKLWGLKGGLTYFRNCLLSSTSKSLKTMFFQGTTSWPDQYKLVLPDYFVYLMERPSYWVRGQEQAIEKWSAWQAGGRERNSVLARPTPCFVDRENEDFRPRSTCPASAAGSDEYVKHGEEGMRVARDFHGKLRGEEPSVGAFER